MTSGLGGTLGGSQSVLSLSISADSPMLNRLSCALRGSSCGEVEAMRNVIEQMNRELRWVRGGEVQAEGEGVREEVVPRRLWSCPACGRVVDGKQRPSVEAATTRRSPHKGIALKVRIQRTWLLTFHTCL